ncbi:MAG: ABC transporter permease [bacterium]|nr:ABC transporter permease [bacterium]
MQNRRVRFFVGLPTFVWLLLFYAIPMVVMLLLAFRHADANGDIGATWSLQEIRNLCNPIYPKIFIRTIWLAVTATLLCVMFAIPISYQLARMRPRIRNVFLMLIVVPFWTNFLIRIYAWKVVLHPDGFLKSIFVAIGLCDPDAILLYNSGAVLTVMVYTYLPFAVLPIYSAAEKFDFSMLDAAKDLGAGSFYAFRRVFLPAIMSGVTVAIMVVFIPALGAYLIPDLVGGASSEMIGDKIAQSVTTKRNLPHASALSALLMFGVFAPLLIGMLIRKWRQRAQGETMVTNRDVMKGAF